MDWAFVLLLSRVSVLSLGVLSLTATLPRPAVGKYFSPDFKDSLRLTDTFSFKNRVSLGLGFCSFALPGLGSLSGLSLAGGCWVGRLFFISPGLRVSLWVVSRRWFWIGLLFVCSPGSRVSLWVVSRWWSRHLDRRSVNTFRQIPESLWDSRIQFP